jgi:hypothetical protein
VSIQGLEFDEDTHTYRFGGRVVSGVTTILHPLSDFASVPAGVLAAASAFGTAVHKACELWDLGDLDEEALDAPLVPYLAGWKKFSEEHKVQWLGIEERVFHKTLRYAGTLDRRGLVDGDMSFVDIKSSVGLYASVGPQLAAYQAAGGSDASKSRRFAVQLKDDGEYVLKEYTNPGDFSVFASLLTLRNWCAQHQITPTF